MVKLSVKINMELEEMKERYRQYYNEPKSKKVTKNDLASWVALLAEGDIDSVEQDLDYENI